MNLTGIFDVLYQDDLMVLVRVTHPYDTLHNDGRIVYSADRYSIYLFTRSSASGDPAVYFAFPADDIQLAYSPVLGKIVYQDVF